MIDDVTDAIISISRHFGVMERDMVCCGEVTVQQCVALQYLDRGARDVSSLAKDLGTSVSATTRLVDGLEKKAWLQRRKDPDDGRRVQLVLTDSGGEKAQELRDSTREMAAELLRLIPKHEHQEVSRTLTLIAGAFQRCRKSCCG